MVQAARGADDQTLPTRYVFDEGHQLFDAADDTFALHLSGRETAELRRWLRGAEEGTRQRRRGLQERAADLLGRQPRRRRWPRRRACASPAACRGPAGAAALPPAQPAGPAEAFLTLARQQVYARTRDGDAAAYSLEAGIRPPIPGYSKRRRRRSTKLWAGWPSRCRRWRTR